MTGFTHLKPQSRHFHINSMTQSRAVLTRLNDTLGNRGNVLDDAHRNALFSLACMLTDMAVGKLEGRWAFPLPTGMGKSTAIREWLLRLVELGIKDVAVAVASSQVEELAALKRDLIALGIAPGLIGLKHGKLYDEAKARAFLKGDAPLPDNYASEPSEGACRQILLVTHARVRGGESSLTSYYTFNGRPRDLMIFDESLITTDAVGLRLNKIEGGAHWLRTVCGAPEAADFVASCHKLLTDALEKAKATGTAEAVVTLPDLDDATVAEYTAAAGKDWHLEEAREIIGVAGQQLRVFDTSAGGAAFYNVSVPESIRNIMILDASHPIRSLIHADKSIRNAENHWPLLRQGIKLAGIKSYEAVTIKFQKRATGKGSMATAFTGDVPQASKIAREIADLIKSLPAHESIVVFTHKGKVGKGRTYASILTRAIQDAGIDTAAMVEVKDSRGKVEFRQRISVSTFGKHTGSNAWSHCHHVILAGVMLRSEEDLGASFIGASNDLTAEVPRSKIADLERSEAAHVVYQAASRGRCRITHNGKALPMTLHLMFNDRAIIVLVKDAMPGVRVEDWKATTGEPDGALTDTLARRIAEAVGTLPPDMTTISIRKLKEQMKVTVNKMAWTRALDAFLSGDNQGWMLQGRSLVRASALFSE